jgi:DNA-binding transcriptional ArsR family regulator
VGHGSKLIRALNHSTRVEILKWMRRTSPASPKEIAEALAQPLSSISYHVHILEECEAVILVNTVPRRGSMEHFYEFSVTEQ